MQWLGPHVFPKKQPRRITSVTSLAHPELAVSERGRLLFYRELYRLFRTSEVALRKGEMADCGVHAALSPPVFKAAHHPSSSRFAKVHNSLLKSHDVHILG